MNTTYKKSTAYIFRNSPGRLEYIIPVEGVNVYDHEEVKEKARFYPCGQVVTHDYNHQKYFRKYTIYFIDFEGNIWTKGNDVSAQINELHFNSPEKSIPDIMEDFGLKFFLGHYKVIPDARKEFAHRE